MANTYELIASSTVGSGGAASITFSSIPSTYTDLLLFMSLRSTETGNWVSYGMSVNGSSANFTWKTVFGSSGTPGSNTSNQFWWNGTSSTANTFANISLYCPNYTSSNYKSFSVDGVVENNSVDGFDHLGAGLWSQTAAINSITMNQGSYNFAQYSTAYLYGIKNS